MQTLLLALAALLAMPGQTPVDTSATTTFRDTVARFTYTYPASFQNHPEVTAQIADRLKGDANDPWRKCVTIPLFSTQVPSAANGGEFGMIILFQMDHRCVVDAQREDNLGVLTQQMTQKILNGFGNSSTEDPLNYKLDRYDAAFAQGSAPARMLGEGKMLHAASVCTLAGPTTFCWLIVDTNYRAMPALVATTVAFTGQPELPLVPRDMVQAW